MRTSVQEIGNRDGIGEQTNTKWLGQPYVGNTEIAINPRAEDIEPNSTAWTFLGLGNYTHKEHCLEKARNVEMGSPLATRALENRATAEDEDIMCF